MKKLIAGLIAFILVTGWYAMKNENNETQPKVTKTNITAAEATDDAAIQLTGHIVINKPNR